MTIKRNLQQHQWKAFRRSPMFERDLGIKIFMYFLVGFYAMYLLALGFFLDLILLKVVKGQSAIATFNSIILCVFAVDFVIKFFFKSNQSMQIAPYLSLPVKRNTLFNFLLRKEFTNLWNFYLLFLIVPFSFKAITPYYGYLSVVLYILFFYLLCVVNSLIVSFANNLTKRSAWFYILIAVFAFLPFVSLIIGKFDLGYYTQKTGEWLLNNNPLVWAGLAGLIVVFWIMNRMQMRSELYKELQGEKAEKISSFSKLSFLGQFGEIGALIQLEIRMILRSKRLKNQTLLAGGIILLFFIQILYNSSFSQKGPFILLLYTMISVGFFSLTMGQLTFSTESSFFDGMMTRNLSIYNMLKGKYLFYSSFAVIISFLLLIPAFQGKIDFMLVIANFFYVIGPVSFMIFQNAVYNKTYIDLFNRGMMNWQGQSGNRVAITMITMFLPVILVLIINSFFGKAVAYWFMITVGILFALTSQQWLRWTYSRFLKRKYKNMEGFRSNA